MRRTTLILILVLVFLTGVVVFLALQTKGKDVSQVRIDTQPIASPSAVISLTPQVPPTAVLSFDQPQITVRAGSTNTVNIVLDGKSKKVSGVQLEMKFDPQVLSNVKITNPESSFFGAAGNATVLYSDVNTNEGHISYAVGITPLGEERTGIGDIATITFTVKPSVTIKDTSITILPSSIVTQKGVNTSILKSSEPLLIKLNSL